MWILMDTDNRAGITVTVLGSIDRGGEKIRYSTISHEP